MADTQKPERDPDLVTYGAFSGVRNNVDSERFGPTDLERAENVDIDETGGTARRNGYVKRNATATHSVWGDGGVLGFCVQAALLKRIAFDYTLTTVRSGLTPGLAMRYTKVNDTVYFANGDQTGAFDNNAARSWGLPVPPLPSVAVTGGNLPAGIYQFVTTYVRNDGQESGARTAGTVTVGENSALVFTLVAPTDTGISYQNIYISPPNGDVLYHALTIPVLSLSGSYASNALDLTYDLKTQMLSAPPAGHLIGYYSSRMYVAVDDALFPSEPFAYELFDLRNYIPMNGRVTLIAPFDDKEYLDRPGQNSGLFLGTDRNCGVLVGNDPDSFQYVPKTDYGAIEGALDYVDGSFFGDGSLGARRIPMWLTVQGICVGLPGMNIRNLTRGHYNFTAAGRGAAVFDPTPPRFIALSNY